MGTEPKNNRKRKVKHNKLLSRAKKKMKEGRFNILDGETYEYFLRIGESLKTISADSDEDKVAFSSNVLKETAGKEWEVMSHAMSSRILEALIPWANWGDLEELREATRDRRNWDGMGCPARVLETMLKDATSRIQKDGPEKVECVKFLETKSRFFMNNLEHQIWEPNANHLTRCCLSCCAETEESQLHDIVKETSLYVISWGQLNDHFNNAMISAFLQILLQASRKCCGSTCDKILKHLDSEAFAPNSVKVEDSELPVLFKEESILRLLEESTVTSSSKMYVKLFTKYFQPRLLTLANSDTTSIAVTKLISACSDKTLFDEIYTPLMDGIDVIMEVGKAKILTSLSERCVALTTKQGDFMQKLKTYLECDKKETKFALCLLTLKKLSSTSESESVAVDLNGSKILQNLLKFNKPIKVVESLLSMEGEELRLLAEDTKGSWVFNGFLESASVGEKSRLRLLYKFKGQFLALSSSKFGSRVFDALWASAKAKERQVMISELDRTLLSTVPGRVVARKIQLELYINDKKSWLAKHSSVKSAET